MQGSASKSYLVNSNVSSISFTVTVNNSTTNTIGSPNPTPDSYGISVQAVSGGAVVSSNSYSSMTAHGAEPREVALNYSGNVDQVNVVLTGIDRGFWGGNFGPIMCSPALSTVTFVAPAPEPTQTETPTPQASPSPTPTDGATATTSPTPEPSLSPSATPEPSPTVTETPTASSSPSPEPSTEQTQSPEPTPTPQPSLPPSPTFPENSIRGIIEEGGILQLVAPITKVFTSIFFASYGTPTDYQVDPACHAESSLQKVFEFVVGRQLAEIAADNGVFGDPCGGTYKRLAVVAVYGDSITAPSTSDSATVVSPSPSPSPSVTSSPEPSPSPSPEASPISSPEPSRTPEPAPQPQITPLPTPLPSATPEPSPSPTPTEPPAPEPEPSPEPSPDSPSPTPSPEATPEPSPTPSPEETPTPQPSPTPSPEPSSSASPEPEPKPTDNASEPPVVEDKPTTAEEKAEVGLALVAALAPGEALSAAEIKEAGISYEDLPPATPVEVRTDAEGNPVIITAEVADALTLVENPAELVGALFSDPAKALLALGSLGADMSPEEREDAQKAVVAAVVVGQLATGAATSVATQRRVG